MAAARCRIPGDKRVIPEESALNVPKLGRAHRRQTDRSDLEWRLFERYIGCTIAAQGIGGSPFSSKALADDDIP
jgi:hypothetical protein